MLITPSSIFLTHLFYLTKMCIIDEKGCMVQIGYTCVVCEVVVADIITIVILSGGAPFASQRSLSHGDSEGPRAAVPSELSL